MRDQSGSPRIPGLPSTQPWVSQAACRSKDGVHFLTDLFFPGQGGDARPAEIICSMCPVRVECLNFALDTRQIIGVWGGLSEFDRRRIRRKRVEARRAERQSAVGE